MEDHIAAAAPEAQDASSLSLRCIIGKPKELRIVVACCASSCANSTSVFAVVAAAIGEDVSDIAAAQEEQTSNLRISDSESLQVVC